MQPQINVKRATLKNSMYHSVDHLHLLIHFMSPRVSYGTICLKTLKSVKMLIDLKMNIIIICSICISKCYYLCLLCDTQNTYIYSVVFFLVFASFAICNMHCNSQFPDSSYVPFMYNSFVFLRDVIVPE